MKDVVYVNTATWSVLGIVNFASIEQVLQLVLLILTIGFTAWRWWRAAKKKNTDKDDGGTGGTVALVFWVLFLCGCNSITFEKSAPDGSRVKIESNRLLWASEGIVGSLADSNGVIVSISIQKSNPDAQAIGAIAEGVAKGVASGANPAK